MAGAILISIGGRAGNGVSMGGPAFRYIIEAIRSQMLARGGARYLQNIYFGNDESFSNFISVDEQDASGFNCFYDAALAASTASAAEWPELSELWSELLDKLRIDPRWARALPIDT